MGTPGMVRLKGVAGEVHYITGYLRACGAGQAAADRKDIMIDDRMFTQVGGASDNGQIAFDVSVGIQCAADQGGVTVDS